MKRNLVQRRNEECWGLRLNCVGLPMGGSGANGKVKNISMKKVPKSSLKSSNKKTKPSPGLKQTLKNSFESKLSFFPNLDAGQKSSMEVAQTIAKILGIIRKIITSGCESQNEKLFNIQNPSSTFVTLRLRILTYNRPARGVVNTYKYH